MLGRCEGRVKEELVFTPFEEKSLAILQKWLASDSATEVRNSFGTEAYGTIKGEGQIDYGFVVSLLEPQTASDPSPLSMLITIRTEYHALVHIGFIQFAKAWEAPRTSCIKHLYISRAFRHKDYEYKSLQKALDFAFKELHSERCLIWVDAANFLFLSMVKTLSFKLVRAIKGTLAVTTRYLFMIVLPLPSSKLPIHVTPNSCGELATMESATVSAMPDFLSFKNKLFSINRVHGLKTGTRIRSSVLWYTPIIRCPSQRPKLSPRPNLTELADSLSDNTMNQQSSREQVGSASQLIQPSQEQEENEYYQCNKANGLGKKDHKYEEDGRRKKHKQMVVKTRLTSPRYLVPERPPKPRVRYAALADKRKNWHYDFFLPDIHHSKQLI